VTKVTQSKVTGKKGDASGYAVGSIVEYRDIVDGKEIHRFDLFNNHLIMNGVNYSQSPQRDHRGMSKDAPKRPDPAPEVDVADIPLPPEEKWDDLDNRMAAAADKAEAKPAPRAAVPPARLEFEGSAHERVIPLKHPFKHPETGEMVREITVRRLADGRGRGGDRNCADRGLLELRALRQDDRAPVPVLRGLMDEDGDAVTDAAYDFLPRVFRTEPAS
jgi:hypothetical protein